MTKKNFLLVIYLLVSLFTEAQVTGQLQNNWRVLLKRKDSVEIVFQLERKIENGKIVFYVVNAAERIKITDVKVLQDSIFFSMPAFESSFRVQVKPNGDLSGTYIKGTAGQTQYWPMIAYANSKDRFRQTRGNAKNNVTGKWDVSITRANGSIRKALAVFKQEGNRLTGSFLTPSADYRYFDGIVTGDSLLLSSFDGDNVHLLTAKINDNDIISGGVFFNGYNGKETWTAKRNNIAALPEIEDPTRMRAGYSKLDFTFKDIYDNPVSINDEKYKNKVVIVQLM